MKKHYEGYDAQTGVHKRSWVEPDGTIIFSREQDAEPVLEANNVRRQALGEAHNFGKHGGQWVHLAEIPSNIYHLWMTTLGDWKTDEFARRKWIERLNSNEYRSLRIDKRRL